MELMERVPAKRSWRRKTQFFYVLMFGLGPISCIHFSWASDASISIATLREAQVEISQSWEVHKFEVWATFFDTQEPHLLYTSSEDSKFCCWDLRESPSKLVFQNTKTHKMGVCSITKSASNSNITLTGSYDEFLRVWDVLLTNKPVNEKSICLGGGVWKVKPHPYIPGLVLAACMHNGFAVVSTEGENIEVIESYSKHGSLVYGADWQRGGVCNEGGSKRTLVDPLYLVPIGHFFALL